ncbi:hypothetical protein ACLI4Z_08920 [Natrialbaceae archaeon A-arb3/5]
MTYSRSQSDEYEPIDRWADGVGWLAHPTEPGRRASHAVQGDDGCWLLDPVWSGGIDDHIAEFADDRGESVAGVAVCSSWHARDADRFARRFDVPVVVPEWMGSIEEHVDAPIQRYETTFDPAVDVVRCQPIPTWDEAILEWDHGTLYVPESLGTIEPYTVGDERIGLELFRRLDPPHSLRRFEPDQVLVGHGEGVFDEATRALEYALAGARRRFPRAVFETGPATARSLLDAIRG